MTFRPGVNRSVGAASLLSHETHCLRGRAAVKPWVRLQPNCTFSAGIGATNSFSIPAGRPSLLNKPGKFFCPLICSGVYY